MSEATLTKIQADVSDQIAETESLAESLKNNCDSFLLLKMIQCAKMEAELAIYTKSQPLSTACEA